MKFIIKTAKSSQFHFLTWSLVSIGVLLLLICVLGVIFMIWSKRKNNDENKHLLKTHNQAIPTSQLPEEENIAGEHNFPQNVPNQPMFIIGGNEHDLETEK